MHLRGLRRRVSTPASPAAVNFAALMEEYFKGEEIVLSWWRQNLALVQSDTPDEQREEEADHEVAIDHFLSCLGNPAAAARLSLGLVRRWPQAPVRMGVGSNPTAVTPSASSACAEFLQEEVFGAAGLVVLSSPPALLEVVIAVSACAEFLQDEVFGAAGLVELSSPPALSEVPSAFSACGVSARRILWCSRVG